MRVLTHSPADVIRKLLVDLSLGALASEASATNWPVYFSAEPVTPDNAITVYDTPGVNSGRSMVDGKKMGLYGFQVRVRATDARVGWIKAHAIQATLAEVVYDETVVIGASRYLVHAVSKIGDVLSLGKDLNSARSLFTLNAVTTIKQIS